MDIPHWAQSMVSNYRRELSIPETVSDLDIYVKAEELAGMDHDDKIQFMKEDFNL